MTTNTNDQTVIYINENPPPNTAAVDESLNFQPAPAEPVFVGDITTSKPTEDTVVAGALTNLKAQIRSKLPAAGINTKATLIALICGSSFTIIILGILSIIPILQIIIGQRYVDECPINWRIPHYLIVAGIVGLVGVIVGIVGGLLKLYGKSKPNSYTFVVIYGSCTCSVVLMLITIFTIGWFIAGCIWVFRVWNEVQYKDRNESNYCHSTLYRFAFWLLLISIFFYLFSICRTCGQTRKQLMNKRKRSAIPVPTTEP